MRGGRADFAPGSQGASAYRKSAPTATIGIPTRSHGPTEGTSRFPNGLPPPDGSLSVLPDPGGGAPART